MEYNFKQDLISIREILEITQEELADKLSVKQITISRQEQGQNAPSAKLMEQTYNYAFGKGIQLNRLKEMLWSERIDDSHVLLFHGAKNIIEEPLNVSIGRANNDFGQGFYTGESYLQAISFVSGYDKSCVYYLDFNPANLKAKEYSIDQDWMMTIAYYRGKLHEYADSDIVKQLIEESNSCDYIIAPIADNRMFQIIDSFIAGEITDEQCKHCLAATNLGKQYVFRTEKSLQNLNLVERCYISSKEKEYYKNVKASEVKLGSDKVKLAKIDYRGKGKYIDEIL